MYGLARNLLFSLDAERAHELGMAGLEAAYRMGLNPLLAAKPKPLITKAFGIEFPNPVGCAAGLDKNGAHIDALMALGFGFAGLCFVLIALPLCQHFGRRLGRCLPVFGQGVAVLFGQVDQ